MKYYQDILCYYFHSHWHTKSHWKKTAGCEVPHLDLTIELLGIAAS